MTQEGLAPAPDRQSDEVVRDVERVYSIRLTGLPGVFIVDAAAIWDAGAGHGDDLAAANLGKMRLLVLQNPMRLIIRGVEPWQAEILEHAIPPGHLVLDRRTESAGAPKVPVPLPGEATAANGSLAVLAAAGTAIPDHCTAFFVGEGESAERAHPTAIKGAAATDSILRLYGTALAQERAGIAFRAISAGESIPREARAAPESLSGVVRSAERPRAPKPAARMALPDVGAQRALAARAYARLMRNVLPNGAIVGSPDQGRAPGQPNYWFYWQRDGSVTMGHLIDWHQRPPLGLPTKGLTGVIQRYADFVAVTQREGQLGTSRYTINGKPITGFGNPQLDGPPLTAMTLARLAPSARVWELLRRYLDFLLTPEGRGPGMDAWEFIYGWHFNAAFLKRRALLVGTAYATRLGYADDAARYRAEAHHMAAELDAFVDSKLGRFRAFRQAYNPWFAQMSGLDAAVICALLSGRNLPAERISQRSSEQDGAHLRQDLDSLTHPAVLATMCALEDAYATYFAVNRRWTAGANASYGLGRFPEDANDGVGTNGGNPWPLATLWGAQFYYHVAQEVAQTLHNANGHGIALDDVRQAAFFARTVGEEISVGHPIASERWRQQILPTLLARGDGYLNFVVQHMPEDGGVTEQIDRDTGMPSGARDLSWALSELIATMALREQVGLAAF